MNRLIYRRPMPGSALSPILTERSEAELREWLGNDITDRLLFGDTVEIGDYTAVDLVAFFEDYWRMVEIVLRGVRKLAAVP